MLANLVADSLMAAIVLVSDKENLQQESDADGLFRNKYHVSLSVQKIFNVTVTTLGIRHVDNKL